MTTAAALSSADGFGFLSRHTAIDAASDGCSTSIGRRHSPGVDHLGAMTTRPVASPLGGRPYLLVLGNAYWHKNRLFAIRLFRWLSSVGAGTEGSCSRAASGARIVTRAEAALLDEARRSPAG